MHKTDFIQENEMRQFVWDFEIQTDHLIPVRGPDLIKTIKEKERSCCIVDVDILVDHRVKIKENEK